MFITCAEFAAEQKVRSKFSVAASRRTLKRRNQRKKKKDTLLIDTVKTHYPTLGSIMGQPTMTTTLTSLSVTTPAQKKGKPMCYDCDCACDAPTIENRKLTYVQNRVENLAYNKRQDLRKMFRMDDDVPMTGEQLIDAIKNDRFTLRSKEEMAGIWAYGALSYFKSWRGKDNQPDTEGFNLASKELEKLVGETTDTVTLGNFAQQKDALEALSNWQPSNKPN